MFTIKDIWELALKNKVDNSSEDKYLLKEVPAIDIVPKTKKDLDLGVVSLFTGIRRNFTRENEAYYLPDDYARIIFSSTKEEIEQAREKMEETLNRFEEIAEESKIHKISMIRALALMKDVDINSNLLNSRAFKVCACSGNLKVVVRKEFGGSSGGTVNMPGVFLCLFIPDLYKLEKYYDSHYEESRNKLNFFVGLPKVEVLYYDSSIQYDGGTGVRDYLRTITKLGFEEMLAIIGESNRSLGRVGSEFLSQSVINKIKE